MTISRREVLAGLGGLSAGVGLGGVSHWFPLPPPEVGAAWAPGREQFVNSTCVLCPSHCGIRGRVVDGRLVRIDGNPLHPVSQGGLCPKGRAGIQLLYHPGRLIGPAERVGPPGSDDFRPISWEEALGRIVERLTGLRDGGEAAKVAWLTGDLPGILGELVRQFAHAYGTPHVIREGYNDGSARVMQLCQGIASPPAFDLASADLVLSFGAALAEAWWCLPQAARARDAEADRRPRWVQIDTRHSRTAARADEWLGVRPGTYGTLALGLAYVILKEGLFDTHWARDNLLGLEDWRDERGRSVPGFRTLVLRYGRTADVAARTGVPEERVVALAKAFGTAQRRVAVWDHAVAWRTGGLSDALAIHALNLLVGAVDAPGGVLVQPGLPVPSMAGSAPADVAAVPALEPADWASRVMDEAESPLEVLFLYQANPVASAPERGVVERALERIPLVVSFSPFLDASARFADLVLPDHTYLERWQDAPAPPSVATPVWGVVQPMMQPLHETRATGDVVLDLASRIGGEVKQGLPWRSVQALVEERGKALADARRGGTMAEALRRDELRELEARGWWLAHGKSKQKFWAALRDTGGWFDPFYDYGDRSAISGFSDGKVRVFPLEARRLLSATATGLAEGFLPVRDEDTGDDDEHTVRLLPFRVMTLASGGTTLAPWLLEHLGLLTDEAWEPWAEIHPETGRHLGLESGRRVRIESDAGSFEARLRFFEGAQPGVLNVPYGLHSRVAGWGQPRVANPLHAVGRRRDPSSGLPDWYSARVRVTPV